MERLLMQLVLRHGIRRHVRYKYGFGVSGYRSSYPGFYSRRNQIWWEVARLERGPLSLVSTTGEILAASV
jgi:hypothetical protein